VEATRGRRRQRLVESWWMGRQLRTLVGDDVRDERGREQAVAAAARVGGRRVTGVYVVDKRVRGWLAAGLGRSCGLKS
jgi:hypothetical protein